MRGRLRGVARNLGRHRVELPDHGRELDQGGPLGGRDRARVRLQRTVAVVDVAAVDVGRIGAQPELGDQRQHPVLAGPDPLAAELDVLAALDVGVQDPAADPIACLQHRDRASGLADLLRRGEPREPGADDDHVGLAGRRLRARDGGADHATGGDPAGPGRGTAQQPPAADPVLGALGHAENLLQS